MVDIQPKLIIRKAEFNLVAINDFRADPTQLLIFKYDSIHGKVARKIGL